MGKIDLKLTVPWLLKTNLKVQFSHYVLLEKIEQLNFKFYYELHSTPMFILFSF